MEHLVTRGGKEYVPFARNKVRLLQTLKLSHASQSYKVGDVTIRVRIEPGHEFIYISDAPQGGYQFFTTGPQTPTNSFGTSLLYTTGYAVRREGTKVKADGSSFEASFEVPPKWTFVENPQNMSYIMKYKEVWQINGVPEHFFFSADDNQEKPKYTTGVAGLPFLGNTWGQPNPLLSLSGVTSEGVRPGSLYTADSGFDLEYDLAPSFFSGTGIPRVVVPDADWYRRACIRKVTHATLGSRWFIILSDVSNKFYCYPVDAPTDESLKVSSDWAGQYIKTNVADGPMVKTFEVLSLYTGMGVLAGSKTARQYFEDVGKAPGFLSGDIPLYIWQFNSKGTKACAVVLFGTPPATTTSGGSLNSPAAIVVEKVPGMVEVNIDIAITGVGLSDFSFAVSSQQIQAPADSGRWVAACGYTWNLPGHANLDDLVTIEGEIYHPSAARTWAPGSPALDINAMKAKLVVYNKTQSTTLREFLVKGTNRLYEARYNVSTNSMSHQAAGVNQYKALGRILSFDLRILAFVEERCYTEKYQINGRDGFRGTSNRAHQTVRHVNVYAFNQLFRNTVMDPDQALNANLLGVFADTDTSTMFLFPVTQRATWNWSTGRSVFNTMSNFFPTTGMDGFHPAIVDAEVSTFFQSAYSTGQDGSLGDFSIGPHLYSTHIGQAIRVDYKSVFCVHPNGNWSVTSDPIIYYGGENSYFNAEADPTAGVYANAQFPPDLTLMRQHYIDIVAKSRYDAEANEWKTTTTTHRELFNKAYGKTYTEADFHCTFSLEYVPLPAHFTAPDARLLFIVASIQSTGWTGKLLYGRRNISGRVIAIPTVPSELDIRDHLFTSEFPSINIFGSYNQGIRAPSIYYGAPLLRGSPLLYDN
jgi:hypothetical protein